ncbi:ATP-dependent helicase [Paragemmobacter ruber]|uniref:DNA 3'-5' helicase n=1 Tax=Paragemmobacter ruber TaxID=1985673 RepID=A0ABW9Y185_9RHOB|nr:UvrD-helicase domain-containing protein [Rhodobacter ruber]NBE06257.1 UvrD-helicase domain-containing protein [Rhodobacter ruber]
MNGWDENEAFEAAAVPLSQRALMAARPAPYLDDLNPAQREAVEALDGPVLMLAGAGTGKTKALTARIVHLLRMGKARPNEILAVTFTNKAAREMKLRVGRMLGEVAEGMPWMGTFHSLSVKILRRHAELVGLKSNFTILDTDDQIRLLKQLIVAANIDEKRWPARMLAGMIDGWKNRALTPERVPSSEASGYAHRGTELYAQYQERLRTLNACDFGDLLLHCVVIFQAHEDVLAQYQRWFRYILVDEYQDTNVAQYLWLRLLAQGHRNICCVGDDDQSIYGWRGAEVGNILRFEKDFPGAHVVRLEQNYRSTPHILAAASGVIAGNAGRLGKTLWTDVKEGEKVRLIGHWDGEEEARWIGEEIEALQRGRRGLDPVGLDGQAILVRASHQMRAFEDRFLTIGLPYRVIGGPRFYERQEIRDAMAYFRLAVSPEDDLAFERVVNVPKRGLGDKAQADIQRTARQAGVALHEGARELVANGGIGGKGAGQLRAFVEGIDRWHWFVSNTHNPVEIDRYSERLVTLRVEREARLEQLAVLAEGDPLAEDLRLDLSRLASRIAVCKRDLDILDGSHMLLAEMILEESGYTEMWQNDKTPEAPGRLENLKELIKALEQFDNLQGFLEHVALIMDNETEEAGEKVSIMTLHAAKGLEFPVVFLPGWEDGLFPSQRSMDESGLKGLEEERRLAYVGITRAEELCTISFASNRRVYGQWQSQLPSRFIDELPQAHVEVLTPPGLYGGGFGAAAPFAVSSAMDERVSKADVYNSPGWKRMQDRVQTRGVAQPQEARGMVIDATAVSAFSEGDRVFHRKFGYGIVTGIEGDKLEIDFSKAGIKKVVAGFIVAAEDADDVPF